MVIAYHHHRDANSVALTTISTIIVPSPVSERGRLASPSYGSWFGTNCWRSGSIISALLPRTPPLLFGSQAMGLASRPAPLGVNEADQSVTGRPSKTCPDRRHGRLGYKVVRVARHLFGTVARARTWLTKYLTGGLCLCPVRSLS